MLSSKIPKMATEGSSSVQARQMRQIDIERNSHFMHPSIESAADEIRLVRIFPGAFPDPICAEMRGTNAFYEHTYTGLSYQWGDAKVEDDVAQILLNEQIFWVRRNLWEFLNRARGDPLLYHRLFWIDAICINQNANNNSEKSSQVAMMDRIYVNAHKVLCWLGEPTLGMESDLKDLRIYLSRATTAEKETCALRGLKFLMNRPYWTRLWIVQEVILAQRITLMCGAFFYSWARILDLWDDQHEKPGHSDLQLNHRERINAALQYMGRIDTAEQAESQTPFDSMLDWGSAKDIIRWSRLMDPQRRRPRTELMERGFELIETLNAFQKQQCGNPLDRLYGLLGLYKGYRHELTPDYNKTLVEVYADVLNHVLGRNVRVGYENGSTNSVPDPLRCVGLISGCGERVCNPFCFMQHYLRISDDDVRKAQEDIDVVLINQHGFVWMSSHPWITLRRHQQENDRAHGEGST